MATDITIDEDLVYVHAVLKGDIHAFDHLVTKYQDPIFNVILRMIGNYETALDLSQETFLKAYQGLNKFREQSSFFTWLFQIALNIANSQRRYYARHPHSISLSSNTENSNNTEESILEENSQNKELFPETQLIQSEMQSLVQKAISTLPKEFKEAIILRDIQGFSYEDIVKILKCPIGTVRSRLHRGREMLKEKLNILEDRDIPHGKP